MTSNTSKVLSFILLLVVCEGAGLVGSIFTMSSLEVWYADLVKPPMNPPNWIFGPVWATLYALMAVAAWLVAHSEVELRRIPLGIFSIHLLVNAAWSFMFFGLRSTFLGFIWILILDAFIIGVMAAFWKYSKAASYLLIPYFFWASFATYLSFNLWSLNP